MAKELSVLQQQAEAIKTEVNKGANTSARVGGMFEDMLDFNVASTMEYNVSKFHPTSGIGGTNKYTLETAIALVPEQYRSVGIKCSFLNESGKPECWEYQGGSWITASFIQIDSGRFEQLGEYTDNSEFIYLVKDAEDRILFGLKKSGKPYFPLNKLYHVIQNEEFLAAWVDATNKILFGIKCDGRLYVAKAEFLDVLNSIVPYVKNLPFTFTESEEFLEVKTDSEGKILEGIHKDGMKYFPRQELFERYDDVEKRTEMVLDSAGHILAYRSVDGIRNESKMQVEQFYKHGKPIDFATSEELESYKVDVSGINISELSGVVDHSLPNLFDKNKIRTYDSDFADKVFAAIGRKTDSTGSYSNNISCKEGDWFTRNDFGTGIVVVLDENENIIGDLKNVGYQQTVQIRASEGQDFSKAAYVVFVVMLANLDVEKIVKAKYVPETSGDYLEMPKLRIFQKNLDIGIETFLRGTSGRYYYLTVDDSDTPQVKINLLDGIPTAELPSDFPKFTITGDFSEYYDGIVVCPIEGGVTEYMFEITKSGMVARYIKKKVNCPRVQEIDGTTYYYGADGGLNGSSGKLNIYKAKGETFELVQGNITTTDGLFIEPHDSYVISVNPLHCITQRYVENCKTIVDGEEKTVTALHVEEQFNGERVWQWKSEDYPELWKDSHFQGNNQDYLHNNTICLDKTGNLCLNNKHANQILVIQRNWDDLLHTGTIGDILWKIGGNRGGSHDESYDVPTRIKTTTEQQWYECHDAIVDSDGLWTIYDNKSSGASRILEFKVDTEQKQLANFKAYTYKNYRGRYMGSVDKCAEGIFLVSWGSFRSAESSNIGIYDFNQGKALFEMTLENTGASMYRVYGVKKK